MTAALGESLLRSLTAHGSGDGAGGDGSSRTGSSLTAHEILSAVSGSISLAAWIFLLLPQLVENYRRQSADGISLAFLLVWFVGDMANLAGASWARLVPTVIALAVYFCIADLVLLLQCLYYNTLNSRRQRLHQQHRQKLGPAARKSSAASQREPALHHHHPHPHHHRDSVGAQSQERAWQGAARLEAGEEQPLLSHRDSTGSIGLPGSHRRSLPSRMRRRTGSSSRDDAPFADGLGEIAEDNANHSAISDYSDGADGASGSCAKGAESRAIVFAILRNGFSVAAVAVAGALGWMVAWRVGAWSPAPPEDAKGSTDMIAGAEILGYVSAACYLGARIPQIIKNYREKSCDGLALLFFVLSLLGNATYGAGILFHSLKSDYLLTNLPWLLGSLGTMAEDIIIFIQFHMYRDTSPSIQS